jgi:hypothetical protein
MQNYSKIPLLDSYACRFAFPNRQSPPSAQNATLAPMCCLRLSRYRYLDKRLSINVLYVEQEQLRRCTRHAHP